MRTSRLKPDRAQVLLDLETTNQRRYRLYSYWFEREHPGWAEGVLVDPGEAAGLLGFKGGKASVYQGVKNGTLVALRRGRSLLLPRDFVKVYARARTASRGVPSQPPQLVQWRQQLWGKVREMNKTGVHGTPVFHRSGPFRAK